MDRTSLIDLNKKLLSSGRKFCNGCDKILLIEEFQKNVAKSIGIRSKCKYCRNSHRRKFRQENKAQFLVYESSKEFKEKQFKQKLRREYGLTLEQFELMIKVQDNKCKICKQPERSVSKKRLAIDHCHKTGRVRSLLCHNCNVVLGLINENEELLEQFAKYIKENKYE